MSRRSGGTYDNEDGTWTHVVSNADGTSVGTGGGTAFAYEQKTVDNTAGGVSLTSATYANATRATLRLETGQIRYRWDGAAAPTSSVGTLMEIGESIELTGAATIAAFRAIRTTSTSGVLSCTYAR